MLFSRLVATSGKLITFKRKFIKYNNEISLIINIFDYSI